MDRLDPAFAYPMYPQNQMSAASAKDLVTHKMPDEMNRHDRRRALSIQRHGNSHLIMSVKETVDVS